MTADEIVEALRRLRVPHERIADAIGRDRTAATKMLGGSRNVKVSEIEPLTALVSEYEQNTAIDRNASSQSPPGVVQIAPQYLEVRYRTQAGFWAEVEDLSATFDHSYAVAPDPRYAAWPQWLELVEGDSADIKIKPGSYAHVVDAQEMGYAPRHEDWVIVERRRNGGRERERSVKQVEITRTGIELWPRSTNPRWSEPLKFNGGAEDDETVEVQIVGLVIGAYAAFK